jgi:hypothetical protein
MTDTLNADVVIVENCPVVRMLALKSGLRAHTVIVLERQAMSYFLPRAVHFDDETGRIFQSVEARPDDLIERVLAYDDFYEWCAAVLSILTRLDWSGRGPSGREVSHFIHQPTAERVLDDRIKSLPDVKVIYSARAIDCAECQGPLEVTVAGDDGSEFVVSANSERTEHVEAFIAASMSLGEVICIFDAEPAITRDVAMKSDLANGSSRSHDRCPRWVTAITTTLRVWVDSAFRGSSCDNGRSGLFDDVVAGYLGLLIFVDEASAAQLTEHHREHVSQAGSTTLLFGLDGLSCQLGEYAAWLFGLDAVASFVRPDYYLFGAAAAA